MFMVDNLQERMFRLLICSEQQQTDACMDTHVYSYQVDEPESVCVCVCERVCMCGGIWGPANCVETVLSVLWLISESCEAALPKNKGHVDSQSEV